jgi:hypothetical protein
MTEPLDLDAISARAAAATPDSPRRVRMLYEHGGGRMYDSEPPEGGGRDLILDAYDSGNRDFYFAAHGDVVFLLSRLRAAEAVVAAAREASGALDAFAQTGQWYDDLNRELTARRIAGNPSRKERHAGPPIVPADFQRAVRSKMALDAALASVAS